MKKIVNPVSAIIICIFLVYSMTHRPDDKEFESWLNKEYQITCGPVSCTKINHKTGEVRTLIETGSRTKDGYLLFNTVAKTFEGKEGRQTTIKAIGFLGKYYPLVEDVDSAKKQG
ncbi:hypothetical protein [Bacillus sp. AK031]